MSSAVADRLGHPLIRSGAVLGLSAFITVLGLFAAVLLLSRAEVLSAAVAALPLLLLARLATLCMAGLHRWSFSTPLRIEVKRILVAATTGSILFAPARGHLGLPIVAVELLVTGLLLASFRIAPRMAEDFTPPAEASRCAAEGPRRELNILVAALALVLSLPLWIAIAVAIKLTSRGPVFYLQERVGLERRVGKAAGPDPRRKHDLGGRPFKMIKFRTMRVDAEDGTGAVWAKKVDPRATPIGSFLRHTRLDELPQLLNVLKGDMNVVGPRPERPTIFAELRTRLPDYAFRQRARPGITGHAQVNLEADTSVDDVSVKLSYDLQYLSRACFLVDAWIMLKTIPVMLFRDKLLRARPRAYPTPDSTA